MPGRFRRGVPPIVNSSSAARPWGIAIMFSLRVSAQRTGRSSVRASQATRISSTPSILAPKPPPTSGATTRTSAGVEAEAPARPSRSWCGVCVESHERQPPVVSHDRGARRAARAGTPPSAGSRARPRRRPRSRRRASRRAPPGGSCRRSCRRRGRAAPRPSSACARVGHGGQRVVVDEDELGGVDAFGCVSVTTTATMSPTKRTDVARQERAAHPLDRARERRRLERRPGRRPPP